MLPIFITELSFFVKLKAFDSWVYLLCWRRSTVGFTSCVEGIRQLGLPLVLKAFDSWVYLLCVLRRVSFRLTSERRVIWRLSCLLCALTSCLCRWRNTASSFCVLRTKIQKLRSTCLAVLSRWSHCTRMPFCLKFPESSRLLYCLPFILKVKPPI